MQCFIKHAAKLVYNKASLTSSTREPICTNLMAMVDKYAGVPLAANQPKKIVTKGRIESSLASGASIFMDFHHHHPTIPRKLIWIGVGL